MSTAAQNFEQNPTDPPKPASTASADSLDSIPWLPCLLSLEVPIARFTIGALLCALSGTFALLVFARVLQGCGSAAIMSRMKSD